MSHQDLASRAAALSNLSAKIKFPCEHYPVKVLGYSAEDYLEFVLASVSAHCPDLDHRQVKVQESRNGRFTSVTLFITATGVAQLEALHLSLKNSGRVKMVI